MDKPTPMEGFYETDPNAYDQDPPIYLSHLIAGLQSVTHALNLQTFMTELSAQECGQLAGLCSAANILANLIAKRQTNEEVVVKPQPRNRKPRTQRPKADNVVPLRSA